MMKQRTRVEKNIISCCIYIILTFAVFNDILRIPGTSISFFRMCLPLCVIFLLLDTVFAKHFLKMIIGLGIVTIIQYWIFYRVYRSDLSFSWSILFKYFILYVTIIIVFLLVLYLRELNPRSFKENIWNYIIYIGFALMIIAILDRVDTLFFSSSFFGELKVDNENNYGCFIAAVIPFLIVDFQKHKKIRDVVGLCLGLGIIIFNDSKAALFGIIFMGIIFVCVAFPARTGKQMFLYRYLVIVLSVLLIIMIIIANPSIHGYTLQDTIYQPFRRIIENDPYSDYQSSISYRTNTTLACFLQLKSTGFMGIGMGNTGVLLKHDFPNLNPEYQMAIHSPVISLHNSWLEFALDFGLIAFVIFFLAIKYVVKLYFGKGSLTYIEKIRVMYIAGFPLWIISTAGIYTLYYLFIVMGYLLFVEELGDRYVEADTLVMGRRDEGI